MTEISLIVTLNNQFNSTQLTGDTCILWNAAIVVHHTFYLYLEPISPLPPWGPGGLSRECVLRIPMRVVKGD